MGAARPLCYFGNPVLKKKAKDIPAERIADLTPLIEDMFETMYLNDGVGLAAPQVNESINLIVMNASWDKEKKTKGDEEVFINLKILKAYGENCEREEGCLSVPEIHEKVKRKDTVDIEFFDRHGKKKTESGITGMRARVIQHETDHLLGILFVDRLSPTKKLFIRSELKEILKDYS